MNYSYFRIGIVAKRDCMTHQAVEGLKPNKLDALCPAISQRWQIILIYYFCFLDSSIKLLLYIILTDQKSHFITESIPNIYDCQIYGNGHQCFLHPTLVQLNF